MLNLKSFCFAGLMFLLAISCSTHNGGQHDSQLIEKVAEYQRIETDSTLDDAAKLAKKTPLVTELNEKYPYSPPIGKDSIWMIFKENTPLKIGNFIFRSKYVFAPKGKTPIDEIIPGYRVGANEFYHKAGISYQTLDSVTYETYLKKLDYYSEDKTINSDTTTAFDILIRDFGYLPKWVRAVYNDNTSKGIYGDHRYRNRFALIKNVGKNGQTWSLIKRTAREGTTPSFNGSFDDPEIYWITLFNNRFVVMIKRSRAGDLKRSTVSESDLDIFHQLVDAEYLNKLPN